MTFHNTALNDALIIDFDKFEDERGFFARTFCIDEFREQGIHFPVTQANISFNFYKQTLRGMHFQKEPHAEGKLIRCIKGGIYDVIIDIRPQSSTYMQWTGVELTEQNCRMLYVPKGFAHGFLTLKDDTEVTYQVSGFYVPEAEQGIRWDDPAFNILWPLEPKIISDKDKRWQDYEKEMIEL